MPDPALVIIARAPEAGRVKTRLAADIGVSAALAVYRQLLGIVAQVQSGWAGPVLLTSTGAADAWIGTGLEHLPRRAQADGGLGCRIAAALQWGLAHRDRAIAIGTDCPGLTTAHLSRLAAAVPHAPVAFGPAADGGYWGVAVADPAAIPIFADDALPWSTPGILRASRQRLAEAGFSSAITDTLADCDDADDLAAAASAGFLAWQPASEMRR